MTGLWAPLEAWLDALANLDFHLSTEIFYRLNYSLLKRDPRLVIETAPRLGEIGQGVAHVSGPRVSMKPPQLGL